MLVATTIMLLGLLAGIIVAQLRGLRLGGVIVIPLSAVYLLRSFETVPIFLVSVIAAYTSLWIVKNRLLVFGRRLFVISIVVGALVPILVFGMVTRGPAENISTIDFLLSIMPGIAAYNLHRLTLDDRIMDALWGLSTLFFLSVVGIGLIIAVGLSPLAGFLPPVLLGGQSDIAIAFGLTQSQQSLPVLASRWELLGLITGGLLIAELLRSRYGLRIGGVVVVPVLVLLSFRNAWMLPLWLVTAALAFAGIYLLHWWALVYGRVLLSMSVVFGLIAAISVAPTLPVTHGLLPFFVGIFGGVTAYNVHVVPSSERVATGLVTVSTLVAITAVSRLFILPPPDGLLTTVTGFHVAVGTLLLVPGLLVLVRFERRLPPSKRGLSPDSDWLAELGLADSVVSESNTPAQDAGLTTDPTVDGGADTALGASRQQHEHVD